MKFVLSTFSQHSGACKILTYSIIVLLLFNMTSCSSYTEPPAKGETDNTIISDISESPNASTDDIEAIDAIEGVLRAYENHQVVAIGDVHGLVEEKEFILSLIGSPEFYENVKNIVIETGNARYQEFADAYVNGEVDDKKELQKIWQDLTVSGIGPTDKMSNQELFDAVRAINNGLPSNERMRILLGDPPIDWESINTKEDFDPWLMQRDSHYINVVLENIYEGNSKGLLICGASHLTRSVSNMKTEETQPKKTMLDIIEDSYPGSVYLIHIHTGFGIGNEELEQKLTSVPCPSLLSIKNTWLGVLPSDLSSIGNQNFENSNSSKGSFNKSESNESMTIKQAAPKKITTKTTKEQSMDAYLYLGNASSLTIYQPPVELYSDDVYFNELNRRHMIVRGQELNRQSLLEEKPSNYLENY